MEPTVVVPVPPVIPAAPAPASAAPAPAPTAPPAGAPAPAAPAAAPVQPAPLNVDPPKPPPTPDAPDGTVVVEYSPTGDPGLDIALGFVGDRGFGPDRPEIQAAQKGDFAPLEAALKGMGDKAKGYERYLNVAKESYKRSTEKTKAQTEATTKAVTSAVGGVENWNAIHAWVVAEADDAQRAAINKALSGGEFLATAMARQLAELYKSSGKSTLPPKGVAKTTAAAEVSASGALSPEQFKAEVRKLEAKYGNRLMETEAYADIKARRLSWRPRQGA